MEILGISGSLRADSHNTRLLRGARTLLPSGAELVLFDALGTTARGAGGLGSTGRE